MVFSCSNFIVTGFDITVTRFSATVFWKPSPPGHSTFQVGNCTEVSDSLQVPYWAPFLSHVYFVTWCYSATGFKARRFNEPHQCTLLRLFYWWYNKWDDDPTISSINRISNNDNPVLPNIDLKPREVQTSYLRDHSVVASKVTCALIGIHVRPLFYTF